MGHLVSVIMPAYNAEAHVAEAVRSVLDQTYQEWELLLVDDGSTDRTAEVVREIAATDGRIKYLYQENGRQGKARNAGLRVSRGDLVAFLDADDLWVSDKLERQVATLGQVEADVVYSDGYIFSGEETWNEADAFSTVNWERAIYGRFTGPEMFRHLFVENRIPILSVLARREPIEEVQLFTEERECQNCEDYDLWLKLAQRGAVFYGMNERLVRYRRHVASMTNRQSNQLRPMIAVVKKYEHDGGLAAGEVRRRMRGLYRLLVSALIEEGKIAEARECMKEFSSWDRSGLITSIQSVLIRALPGKYNFISRECLYRAEWHLKRLTGKLIKG